MLFEPMSNSELSEAPKWQSALMLACAVAIVPISAFSFWFWLVGVNIINSLRNDQILAVGPYAVVFVSNGIAAFTVLFVCVALIIWGGVLRAWILWTCCCFAICNCIVWVLMKAQMMAHPLGE